MENGARALIMAAEILIAVMIITVAVYVFNEWGEYSKNTAQKINDSQVEAFNHQFLKYYGDRTENDGTVKPIECTIHDVVSIANLAQKNNVFYQENDRTTYSEQYSAYIQIDFMSRKNLEKYTQEELIKLIQQYDLITNADGTKETKYFKVSKYIVSSTSSKVIYMKFIEI